LASNPDVDPIYLSIGTVLVIPIGRDQSADFPTPTPIPIDVEDPICYQALTEGVWCFALVNNNFEQPLEGITGKIELLFADEEKTLIGNANTPINVLPAGKSLPLVAYFSYTVDELFTPYVNEVTGLLASADEPRNKLINLMIGEIELTEDGNSATVSGFSLIPDENSGLHRLSVVLIAYDNVDQVVGIRRVDEVSNFTPGERVPFETTVYSLEAPISRVEALGELDPR
jgi:hypothetical protein